MADHRVWGVRELRPGKKFINYWTFHSVHHYGISLQESEAGQPYEMSFRELIKKYFSFMCWCYIRLISSVKFLHIGLYLSLAGRFN